MIGASGNLLRGEFERLALSVVKATSEAPDAALSCRVQGIWEMRSRNGALLAEITPDGTLLENSFDLDAAFLERIADLRSFGMSSRRIMEWFGAQVASDAARDAQEVLTIALRCPHCR